MIGASPTVISRMIIIIKFGTIWNFRIWSTVRRRGVVTILYINSLVIDYRNGHGHDDDDHDRHPYHRLYKITYHIITSERP